MFDECHFEMFIVILMANKEYCDLFIIKDASFRTPPPTRKPRKNGRINKKKLSTFLDFHPNWNKIMILNLKDNDFVAISCYIYDYSWTVTGTTLASYLYFAKV